jgi:NAD(P)-dependent dehydrogenase (short-subunit alcohol dehydrogenase family)
MLRTSHLGLLQVIPDPANDHYNGQDYQMKIIIPGGSGQVGAALAKAFVADGQEVVVLGRSPKQADWLTVKWDGITLGDWAAEIDGSDVVINLAGGSDARVFRSNDRGLSWFVSDTPITKGTPGSGVFSVAFRNALHGTAVGGNYEKPAEAVNNLAFTRDGGKSWYAG